MTDGGGAARRGAPRLVALWLAAACCAAPAWAADPPPARCNSAMPYEGPPALSDTVALPAPGSPAPAPWRDSTHTAPLGRALAEVIGLAHAQVMSAAVMAPHGRWQDTRGADGAESSARLYWASAGKMATAVVILELVEEGRLRLEQPISDFVKDVPNGRVITIDHLLRHKSGLYSANEDARFRAEHRYHTPQECLRIAARHGALFCPGRYWRYSNTGYDLLGMVIEKVEGRPYHEVVNARIRDRLKLATFEALAPDSRPEDVAPLAPSDSAEAVMRPSWGGAAGSIVASAGDMVGFLHALLTGGLLSEATLASMLDRPCPMFDRGTFYGRGLMVYRFGDASGERTWVGHSGGTPGAKAVVAYDVSRGAYVAVALTGDGPAEAAANRLLSRVVAGP